MRNRIEKTFEDLRARGERALIAYLMAGDPTPLRRYAEVTLPVLVLVGEQTFPFLRPAAAEIADVLPKGELRQVPTADHTLTPEAVVPALREFALRH